MVKILAIGAALVGLPFTANALSAVLFWVVNR